MFLYWQKWTIDFIISSVPIDPKQLPDDPVILQRIVVDLTAQMERDQSRLAKVERLLEQLLEAKNGRRSEKLSTDQLALFVCELKAQGIDSKAEESNDDGNDDAGPGAAGSSSTEGKAHGSAVRRSLPAHLKRERIVHDVAEALKHCTQCDQALRPIGEESSERYEFIPAQLMVIEDICKKYSCACTIHTATKPAQPIEKSNARASLLAQVIVAKHADHLPVHRQVKIFRRSGVEFSDQTICGWMRQTAELVSPLYEALKRFVLSSKVVGTDDTPVKVLDRRLRQARKGRIWPYVGDREHRAVVFDYTPTRERAGPELFLHSFRGRYLQADAYAVYDSFFKDPKRPLLEVGAGRMPEDTSMRRALQTPRV